METEAVVEAKAEVAILRARTKETKVSFNNKINAMQPISNNMAITNKEVPKELLWMESVVKMEATKIQCLSNTFSRCSSSNNSSSTFSCLKLTFPASTRFKVRRKRTSSVIVSIPPSKQCMEIRPLVSLQVCSWMSPSSTRRSFCPTTNSSSARSTSPMPST